MQVQTANVLGPNFVQRHRAKAALRHLPDLIDRARAQKRCYGRRNRDFLSPERKVALCPQPEARVQHQSCAKEVHCVRQQAQGPVCAMRRARVEPHDSGSAFSCPICAVGKSYEQEAKPHGFPQLLQLQPSQCGLPP